MSKIALSPNASGSGTLTIAAPNTNTDRTLTLPDASGTVFVSGQALSATTGTFSGAVSATTGTFSGNVTLGSSVLATPSGSAPSYTCRAWVNFNGTGTVAIRASGNVSSITDNGTGDYTVNFTTAMPDANYSISGAQGDTAAPNGAGMFAINRIGSTGAESAPTTSGCRVNTTNSSGNVRDNTYVNVAIFR